jgi:Anti-sigma-K factor rskA/Putative zinc-finger
VKLLRQDLHTLTGAYALDAVDTAERERIQRHLARCPSCAQEARGLHETATRLALASAEPPPPELRARVLAAVAATRQSGPASEPGVAPRAALRGARPGHAAGRRRFRVPRLAAAVTALAVAAVVVLAVLQVSTQSRLSHAQSQQQALAAVLAAPDARTATATAQHGGTVTVVYSRSEHRLIFTTAGLPKLPSGQVYELWLMRPKDNRPAGLLSVQSGDRTAPVLAAGLRPGDQTGLTIEPAGGTDQPTTSPIVQVSLK